MINLPPYPKDVMPGWRGMTLREIQMRRVLVQTRMEIEKYRITAGIDNLKGHTPVFGKGGPVSRIAQVFSAAEYAFMAFKLFRWIRSIRKK